MTEHSKECREAVKAWDKAYKARDKVRDKAWDKAYKARNECPKCRELRGNG